MAIQPINIGTPGAGGGDPAHAAFKKVNENFTNNNHAASRLVGTANGDLMQVGAFGLGSSAGVTAYVPTFLQLINSVTKSCFFRNVDESSIEVARYTASFASIVGDTYSYIMPHYNSHKIDIVSGNASGYFSRSLLSNMNTTIDGNGFIKAASPIINLFSEKIELNNEAQTQPITFEKLGIGDYLIKDSLGFAQEGWTFEPPLGANKDLKVFSEYGVYENGDIWVKTFEPIGEGWKAQKGDPLDIPKDRWISLRLHEDPQPESTIYKTPPDFQPTNLAQAVAEAFGGNHEPTF